MPQFESFESCLIYILGLVLLFFISGINKDATEASDICLMKGFTKGKLNI